MLKRINRILKLVGLNLVHAKRKAPKSEAKRVKEFVEEFDGPKKVPLSDYMGECEWQSTPPIGEGVSTPCAGVSNPGKTHFVGDECPGGHRDPCCKDNIAIGYNAEVFAVNNNAAFEPVDIGCNDHEMTRVEQPNSDNQVKGPTS